MGGAKDLEQQFSTLQAATNATGEEVAQLQAKAEALGASDQLAVSAKQAAEGMTELGRAGQSTSQILESITPVIALAQGAELELGRAAGIVTANLAGFSLEADQSGRVADVLAKAATSAKTTVDQLADALSYAAPAANAAGMSIEATTAIIAKMQNAGIDGSRAGTALNTMLSSLADPASTASKALDKAGISAREFSDVLAELEKGGPSAEKAILAFGTEAGPALRALLSQGAGSVRELQGAMEQSSGSAEKAAATMNENLAGAAEALGSVWEGLKTTLVQPLLEPLEREARSLAATLADFAKSAQMARMKQALVDTFEAGAEHFRAFVEAVDWDQLGTRITASLTNISEAMRAWQSNAEKVAAAVSLAWNALGSGFATIRGVIWAAAGGVNQALSWIIDGVANLVQAMADVPLNPFGEGLGDLAAKIRGAANDMDNLAGQSFENAGEAMAQVGEYSARLQQNLADLTKEAQQTTSGMERLGERQATGAQNFAELSLATEGMVAAFEQYRDAQQSVDAATEEGRVTLDAYRQSYEDAKAKVEELERVEQTRASTANDLAGAQEALKIAQENYAQALADAKGGSAEAAKSLADLAQAVDDAEKKVKALSGKDALVKLQVELASAQEQMRGLQEAGDLRGFVDATARAEALGAEIAALERTADVTATALESIGDVAKDIRTPLEQASQQTNALEIAYKAFMATGDSEGAARIRSQIDGIKQDLEGVADQADDTAGEMVSSLDAIADAIANAKTQSDLWRQSGGIETLYRDGKISADEYGDQQTQVTKKMGELREETEGTGKKTEELSKKTGDATDKTSKFGGEVKLAGDIVAYMEAELQGAIDSVRKYSDVAANAIEEIKHSFDSWNDKIDRINALDVGALINDSELTGLNQELTALGEAVDGVASKIEYFKEKSRDPFNTLGGFYDALAAIASVELQLAEAAEAAKQLEIEALELSRSFSSLSDEFDSGALGLTDYIEKLEMLIGANYRLGDEELGPLRDALADA